MSCTPLLADRVLDGGPLTLADLDFDLPDFTDETPLRELRRWYSEVFLQNDERLASIALRGAPPPTVRPTAASFGPDKAADDARKLASTLIGSVIGMPRSSLMCWRSRPNRRVLALNVEPRTLVGIASLLAVIFKDWPPAPADESPVTAEPSGESELPSSAAA